ncbi:MAG: BatD family protein [Myxococcales bacterium]|nr:BatD family protein [Myxococcales bacterium]
MSARLQLTLAAILTLATVSPVDAAVGRQVTMKVQARRVVMGDSLVVQVTARGEFDDITPPSSDGFDFRQTGRSSQMSIIGARVSRSLVLTYTGAPRRPGKWKVHGANLKFQGKVVSRSADVVIEVVDGRAAMGPALSPRQAQNLRRYNNEPFFVRPVLSTASPYVGQPLVISFELFWARGSSVQGIRELAEPKFDGFEVEDLLSGTPQRQEQVRVGGRVYFRQVTRKVLLTASAAGTFEIIGPRYRVEVGDFFDSRAYKVGPPPVKLTVQGVPTKGRPKSYRDDAIGKFTLRGHLLHRGKPVQKLNIKTGERAVLVYEVAGRGNLLSLPELAPAPLAGMHIEKLPGLPDESVKRTASGMTGKRSWQFLLSFDRPGTQTLPPLTWSFFDPGSGRFQSTRIEGLQVVVSGAALASATAAGAGAQPPTSGNPVLSGEKTKDRLDLRPIAPHARIAQQSHRHFTAQSWYWPAAGSSWAGALLLFGLWGWRRRRQAGAKGRTVAGALQQAQGALAAATDHAELQTAVHHYFAVRAQLTTSGLTAQKLLRTLSQRGVPPQLAEAISAQLEHCDYARFAPGGGDDELRATATRLGTLLADTDTHLGDSKTPKQPLHAIVWLVMLVALSPAVSQAATLDQSFQAANAAYVSGDLNAAERGYEGLLKHGVHASAVHYNLGNVLTRKGRLGEAVGHYRRAQRLGPSATVAADVAHNLAKVRRRLGERARRNHRVLHIFDETPELDVAVARAAPRGLLGGLILLLGALALVLLAIRVFRGSGAALGIAVGVLAALQLICAGWLWHAQRVDQHVRHAVVVHEDVGLVPCSGVGERLDLPEGLEVRVLRTRPDGRAEVRLPNGRSGCVARGGLVHVDQAQG